MRVESWQNTTAESDDSDDNKADNRAKGNAAADRYERAQPFSNEGQISLRPPRAPAQLFEGLIRAKQEAARAEAEVTPPDSQVESPEPMRRSEAFRVPLGAEASPVIPGHEVGPDDDDDDDEKENGKKDNSAASSVAVSSWKNEPLPSIEDVDVAPIDFNETIFDEPPEPARAEGPPADPDFEPIVDAADEPSRRSGGGGGATPPGPPGPPTEFGAYDREPDPDPQVFASRATPPAEPSWASAPNSAPNAGPQAFEQATKAAVNEAEYYAEKRGLRRGLIAGFLTGYVYKAFIANRKMKRQEIATKKQFEKQNETISRFESEQYRLQDQVAKAKETTQRLQEFAAANQPTAARLERPAAVPLGMETQTAKPAEALPPIQEVSEEVHVVDFNGQEVVLQPGQRLERKGWYNVVVDEHGREVQNVIPRGEAFKREQKEKLSNDSVTDGSTPAGAGVFTGQTDAPMIDSGQVDARHELPAGPPPRVDWSHRLPAPKNPIVTAAKSPWLWAAIAILLIAYFTAALV